METSLGFYTTSWIFWSEKWFDALLFGYTLIIYFNYFVLKLTFDYVSTKTTLSKTDLIFTEKSAGLSL